MSTVFELQCHFQESDRLTCWSGSNEVNPTGQSVKPSLLPECRVCTRIRACVRARARVCVCVCACLCNAGNLVGGFARVGALLWLPMTSPSFYILPQPISALNRYFMLRQNHKIPIESGNFQKRMSQWLLMSNHDLLNRPTRTRLRRTPSQWPTQAHIRRIYTVMSNS